jgi:hypothetical protein
VSQKNKSKKSGVNLEKNSDGIKHSRSFEDKCGFERDWGCMWFCIMGMVAGTYGLLWSRRSAETGGDCSGSCHRYRAHTHGGPDRELRSSYCNSGFVFQSCSGRNDCGTEPLLSSDSDHPALGNLVRSQGRDHALHCAGFDSVDHLGVCVQLHRTEPCGGDQGSLDIAECTCVGRDSCSGFQDVCSYWSSGDCVGFLCSRRFLAGDAHYSSLSHPLYCCRNLFLHHQRGRSIPVHCKVILDEMNTSTERTREYKICQRNIGQRGETIKLIMHEL